jgi:hypothetical protein
MNMKNLICDPNRWRQRAEYAQAKADQISWDANLKRNLLRTAEEYDRLAQRAEQWRSTRAVSVGEPPHDSFDNGPRRA